MEEFADVLARWIDAETIGDAGALDGLLDGDFRGDGPRGFVLTKAEWLDRYRSGDLVNGHFAWRVTEMRVHEDTAVVMGIQDQRATYQGEDYSGVFSSTLVARRNGMGWSIVNVQLNRLPDQSPDDRPAAA